MITHRFLNEMTNVITNNRASRRGTAMASKRAQPNEVSEAEMKKEFLKGFSLLALIIVIALMTAAASVGA